MHILAWEKNKAVVLRDSIGWHNTFISDKSSNFSYFCHEYFYLCKSAEASIPKSLSLAVLGLTVPLFTLLLVHISLWTDITHQLSRKITQRNSDSFLLDWRVELAGAWVIHTCSTGTGRLLVEGGGCKGYCVGEHEGQEEEDGVRFHFRGTEPSSQLSCMWNHSLKAST